MEQNLEILTPSVRRSKITERDVIHKTAMALAERFKTDFIWIEEILNNTVLIHSRIEEYEKKGRECIDGVLSDFAVDASFRPSILEPLSVLGAKNTKKIFCVNEGSAQAKYTDDDIKHYSRVLTIDEYKVHDLIYNCWRFSYTILRDLPPPNNSKVGENVFSKCAEETLQSFKRFLKKQKNAIVTGDTINRDQFSDYPWLEWNFLDGKREKIILYKSLLRVDDSSTEENRFFKSEKERAEYAKKEQEKIVISPRSGKIPISYSCGISVDDKFKITDIGKKRDLELREKLFNFRVFAVDVLVDSLAGRNRQDPADHLIDYVLREFSKSEIRALEGKNPDYFNLNTGTSYKHKDSNCFYQIIQAVSLFFSIHDSKLAFQIYREFGEIFKFSDDIEGPHQLWLSYYDFLFLLSTKTDISGQLIENVTAACENMSKAFNRFSMIEIRLGKTIGKISKPDGPVTDQSVTFQLNSYAENEYGQTNLVLPYIDEILSNGKDIKKAAGVFLNDFRDYKPRNKKIPSLRFTKKQAKAIEVLYKAFQKDGYGLVRRSNLIEQIYGEKKAKEIFAKSSASLERISPRPTKGKKKKGIRNKIIYKHRYEWRLEKVLFKAKHPAWKHGMVQAGVKLGGEKTYRICFDFDRPR